MAVHRKPAPPRTLAQWRHWAEKHPDSIPEDIGIRNWPEGQTEGPSWIPLANDHPLKGSEFCWRCIAEAQGFPTGAVPHCSWPYVICWIEQEQTGGNAYTKDPDPDAIPPEPGLPSDYTDTGSFFWERW